MKNYNHTFVKLENKQNYLPEACKPLPHQVAGHFHGNARTKIGSSIALKHVLSFFIMIIFS